MICEEKIQQQLPLVGLADSKAASQNPPLNPNPAEETSLSPEQKSRKYHRQRYLLNREQILTQHKEYKLKNRAKLNATRQKWRERNRDKEKTMNDRFRAKHKDKLIEKGRERYRTNPEKHRAVRRKSYWDCRPRERAFNVAYSKRNRSQITAQRRERSKTDIQYAIGERLRCHLVKAVLRRKTQKADSTFTMLGCSLPDFLKHIEAQFISGMTWENRSEWHIDHFVPVNAFDLTNPEEQRWAYFYMNLRPLWPLENHLKSDKLPDVIPSWLPAPVAARILARSQKDRE